ncbi:MAG: hypothetical protein ACJAWV_001103 [Flammeovirgaceae bacterium]|jgi:hypothetical protein
MDKKSKKEQDKLKREEELRNIFKKADENKSLQLGLPLEDNSMSDDEDSFKFEDVQNPEESHRLFYAIRKLLMQYLPQGKENLKSVRQPIYDEKNLFLTQGHEKDSNGTRGADSRQSYISQLSVCLELVKEWIQKGANSWDLFITFRDINIKDGYKKDK